MGRVRERIGRDVVRAVQVEMRYMRPYISRNCNYALRQSSSSFE